MHEVQAREHNLLSILNNRKYHFDYYQRNYVWAESHIRDLLQDLADRFLDEYNEQQSRQDVASYAPYFLGSIVVSGAEESRSVIDGQQRLTSLTLLLIYLRNLQAEAISAENDRIELTSMITSMVYGTR